MPNKKKESENTPNTPLLKRGSAHQLKLFFLCLLFAIYLAVPPPCLAATYYCDPNGNNNNDGSAAHPWNTLESINGAGYLGKYIGNGKYLEGTVKSGDTVKLRTGFHGRFSIDRINFLTDYIAIEADNNAVPDLSEVIIRASTYWKIKGVRVFPVSCDPNVKNTGNLIKIYQSSYVTIEDCNIFCVEDDVSANWTRAQWDNMHVWGINASNSNCDHLIIRGNSIHNIFRGISPDGASNTLVERNIINNWTEDAMHVAGVNMIIQDNIVTNRWSDHSDVPSDHNGIHADVLQGSNGDLPLTNGIIRRNYICACTDLTRDPNRVGGLQGFFAIRNITNGLIENNVILAQNIAWGINIGGDSNNVKILNNTVIGAYRLLAGGHKGLSISVDSSCFNIIIRNNITRFVPSSDPLRNIKSDHNYNVDNYNPEVEFVDFPHGNVHLAANSHFIDAGSSLDATAEDLARNSRPRGLGYDAGAYEYITTDSNNRAPILQEIGNKSVDENTLLAFAVNAIDPDGGMVTYSAENLPAWATFSSQPQTFSWMPTHRQAGTYLVTFIASDGQAQDRKTITITVNNVPATISVRTDANSIQDSIQAAIDSASDGDTIVVEQGRYYENINFEGKNITLKSTDPNDPNIVASTIIDGNELASAVTFNSSEDANCLITGFTITSGSAVSGGGVYIDSACPIIEKNVIIHNHATEGSGIYCKNSSATIRLNKIIENDAVVDSAMGGLGGAIFCANSLATVKNNLIAGNSASYGSGIVWVGGTPKIVNNTIANNSSQYESYCCAVSIDSNVPSSPMIKNNIIAFNNNGAGIYCWGSLGANVPKYNNIFGNSPQEYGGQLTDQTGQNGNISTNPFFFDPNNYDYHLRSRAGRWEPSSQSWDQDALTSPCIDAGDPNDDYSGEPQPNGMLINMGAYGGTAQASLSSLSPSQVSETLGIDLRVDNLWMYQNLPGKTASHLTANVSIIDDPLSNSSYTYQWELILPRDVNVAPTIIDGGSKNDALCTFAAPSCDQPEGLSDAGLPYKIRVTVTGNDYGNTAIVEAGFGISLLGDINNDAVVNVADRSIVNVFWQTGSAGVYSLRDCDVNCDGVVNVADRSVINIIWVGTLGRTSTAAPCCLR
jgi:hypothetical protein